METTEVKRKKQKKNNEQGWMCKIQKFSFDIDAKEFYTGYCPFFWMTWAALLCAPFALIIRGFALIVNTLANLIKPISENIKERKSKNFEELMQTPLHPSAYLLRQISTRKAWSPSSENFDAILTNALKFEIEFWHESGVTNASAPRYAAWFKENPDWETTHLPEALALFDLKRVIAEEKNKAKDERSKRLSKITANASFCGALVFKILIPFLILVAGFALYLITAKLVLLAMTISLVAWAHAIFVALGVGSFMGICYLTTDFILIWLECHRNRRYNPEEKEPNIIVKTFSKVWGGVTHATKFITTTIKMTYKAECPMIIWGDESGPIEKIK
jgi:hypothetical protein